MKLGRKMAERVARIITTAAAAALVAALAAPSVALGVTELDYDPKTNPVADNVTRLEVNKMAEDTHELIAGATMQVLRVNDDGTETVVDQWVTDGTTHELAKILDVSTAEEEIVYILREIEAPEGYEKAPDTRFVLYSEDFNTKGQVINPHDNVEFASISGSGPEQAFVLNLYDDVTVRTVEREKHVQREVRKKLAQTSDLYDPAPVYALCAGGVAALAMGIHLRRRAE